MAIASEVYRNSPGFVTTARPGSVTMKGRCRSLIFLQFVLALELLRPC